MELFFLPCLWRQVPLVFVGLLVSLSTLLTHCTFFCPAVQYRLVAVSALVFPLAVAIYTASGLPFGLATAIYIH